MIQCLEIENSSDPTFVSIFERTRRRPCGRDQGAYQGHWRGLALSNCRFVFVLKARFTNSCGFTILFAIAWALSGCGQGPSGSIDAKLLPRMNPTNYEFAATMAAVTNAVQKAYETWHYGTSKAYGGRVWQGEGRSEED